MIDLRIWRILLVGVPLSLTVAMFSLADFPEPLQTPIAPDAFEASTAESLTEQLVSSSPEPRPGSDADKAVSRIVQARFRAIQGAGLAEQRFDAEFEGESVELRNLFAILPGQSERQIAVLAHRDVADGSGAVTSLAATAILIEIAQSFSGADHTKTLVFVSTDGGSIGALGAKRFASTYSERELLDAVIVLSAPASNEPAVPFVVSTSTGPQNTSAQLHETAAYVVGREAEPALGLPAAEDGGDEPSPEELADAVGDAGVGRELFSLAVPAGIGEQAPLIEAGIDAVRITSRGELPPAPGADEATDVDFDSIENFGRATLGLLLALDANDAPLETGPGERIDLAGNLLPGWALGVIALAALLAPFVAALEAVGRITGRPENAAITALWVLSRAIPFLAALLVVHGLAMVGVIGRPEFPFDPADQQLGRLGLLLLVGLLAGIAAMIRLLPQVTRPLTPPTDLAGPMALLIGCLAVGVIWLGNPYLALVLVAIPNAWVGAVAQGPAAPAHQRAFYALIGFVPAILLLADLADRFGTGLGPGFAWDALMLTASGQVSLGASVLACVLLGAGVALTLSPRLIEEPPALKVSAPARPRPEASVEPMASAAPDEETSEAPLVARAVSRPQTSRPVRFARGARRFGRRLATLVPRRLRRRRRRRSRRPRRPGDSATERWDRQDEPEA